MTWPTVCLRLACALRFGAGASVPGLDTPATTQTTTFSRSALERGDASQLTRATQIVTVIGSGTNSRRSGAESVVSGVRRRLGRALLRPGRPLGVDRVGRQLRAQRLVHARALEQLLRLRQPEHVVVVVVLPGHRDEPDLVEPGAAQLE